MAQANRHHGVTTTESTEGVRYISDISTAVIGMVCTADDADTAAFPLNKPVFYASAADIIGKAGDKGTLAKSLDGIIDQADAQIVIVRVPHDANADALKANIIGTNSGGVSTGIQALRRAKSACGFVPKILGAPELDSQAVAAELVGVAQATRAFVYASAGGAADLDEVKAYRANFGQREIMLVDNEFTTFDPVLKTEVKAATIARILGLRAKLDQQIGWHKSISNGLINGVTGLQYARSFDLLDKNCEANVLNNNEITTLIREDGFRVWGNRTCSEDPMTAFEVAVRSEQVIQETIASAFLWAMDKPMSMGLLQDIIMGVNAKLAEYVGQGRILGARVFISDKKVTAEAIGAGIFGIDYEWTYVPPLENLQFHQHNTGTFFVNLAEKAVEFGRTLKPSTI